MKLLGAWLYPVKSMRGISLDEATVTLQGLQGDRSAHAGDPQPAALLRAGFHNEVVKKGSKAKGAPIRSSVKAQEVNPARQPRHKGCQRM